MFNHITPPSGGSDHNEQAAEPPNSRRFDERGIALQTVIITVVLIAIAGAIAAVLFSAADDASDELENSSVSVNVYASRNETQCERSGGAWARITGNNSGSNEQKAELSGALRISVADAGTRINEDNGYCKPK